MTERESRPLFFSSPEQPQQPPPEAEKDKKDRGEQNEAQEKQVLPEDLKRKGVDERKAKAEDDVKKLYDRVEGAQKKAVEQNRRNGAGRPPVSSNDIARMTEVTHMRQTGESTAGGVGGVGSEWTTEGGTTEVVIRPNDPSDLAEIQARCAKAGVQLEVQSSPGPGDKPQAALVLKDAMPANRAKVGRELINMALEQKGYTPLKEGMRGLDDMSEQERAMIESIRVKPLGDRIKRLRAELSSMGVPHALQNLPAVLKDLAPLYFHPSGKVGTAMPMRDFIHLSQILTRAGHRIRADVAGHACHLDGRKMAVLRDSDPLLRSLEEIIGHEGGTTRPPRR